MAHAGKWGYSNDDESYHGAFATREEAISEGCAPRFVGQYGDPAPPESLIDGELLVNHVLEQDDYCGESAEDTFDCDPEIMDELTQAVRRVFAEWIDRHNLRPKFVIVVESEELPSGDEADDGT